MICWTCGGGGYYPYWEFHNRKVVKKKNPCWVCGGTGRKPEKSKDEEAKENEQPKKTRHPD